MNSAKRNAAGYEPVGQAEDGPNIALAHHHQVHPLCSRRSWMTFAAAFAISLVICLGLGLATGDGTLFSIRSGGLWSANSRHIADNCGPPSDVPQYFQTSPELWAGPTATGRAPFLAQTRTFNPSATYVPNAPLVTDVPIQGMAAQNESIFDNMGYLSPYLPSPGFGVDEYPLPAGADIIQLQMLSRHGSRYPTVGSNVNDFGDRIAAAAGAGQFRAMGDLAFLNDWKYQLGSEILVPKGRQELFDSGVLHSYMYSQLYNPNSRIIVRTTTQDRMLKSAEYFMAGFFGLEWTQNATIEVIIEEDKFNNSLAGYLNCPNGRKVNGGSVAATSWIENYLQNATDRLSKRVSGYNWTIEDTYAAQTMCPYETVAYGYSRFCDLFTYEEWVGFGYSIDLAFYGDNAFGSPTGRAIGIGYQQEVVARLKNHTLGYSGSQINVTLDNNTATFPLNQSLYLDFSHDSNIIAVLTAFGLKQFQGILNPKKHPGPHNFTVSHLTPFGARLDIEIIRTPSPLAADRSGYLEGDETKYVHFVLNQRTVPLGASFKECDAARVDGWCELETFLKVQEKMPVRARYEHACFGDYFVGGYGDTSDGAPS
ncbi:histidine phosphatase superfamily [Cercophora scortea]|uniref:3-phytase n=1 Tax=Cercophora scortea TaxID=314031 RepID=A0AAE0J3B7_9PEZI|nr:histidine phosphatase superfamily [Cercophora scortea]